MKQLLRDNTFETTILKQLFLQRLLTNLQLILASTNKAIGIEQLVDLTGKIMEVSSPLSFNMHIGVVSKPQQHVATQPDQVCALSTLVENLVHPNVLVPIGSMAKRLINASAHAHTSLTLQSRESPTPAASSKKSAWQ